MYVRSKFNRLILDEAANNYTIRCSIDLMFIYAIVETLYSSFSIRNTSIFVRGRCFNFVQQLD